VPLSAWPRAGGRRGVYSAQPSSGGGGGTLKKLFDWQQQIEGQKVFNIQMNYGSFVRLQSILH
jgi:hypothetical protein